MDPAVVVVFRATTLASLFLAEIAAVFFFANVVFLALILGVRRVLLRLLHRFLRVMAGLWGLAEHSLSILVDVLLLVGCLA